MGGGDSNGIGNVQKKQRMKVRGFNVTRREGAKAQDSSSWENDSPEQTDKMKKFKE